MDFLLSSALVKYEIIFLIGNLIYLVFHFLHSLVGYYCRFRNFLRPAKIEPIIDVEKTVLSEEALTWKAEKIELRSEESESRSMLTGEEKQYLGELIKNIRTRIARGEYQEARARIIEGLSMDKFHKDLNTLLASLYEKEKDYKKAELIYKDLILLHDTDTEIYLRLGFALSIQGKYEIAYEIYKKLLSLDESSMETVEMLANLAHQLGHSTESNEYARLYLKKHPHNIDMLYLVAVNAMDLGLRDEALEALKKVRTFEPYNQKINDQIEKIDLELELERNFQVPEEK